MANFSLKRKQILDPNFLLIMMLIFLTGCKQKTSSGVFLSPQELKKIEECKQKKCPVHEIYSTVGFPVIEEDNRSYYVGTHSERMAFLRPKIIKSEIVELILSKNQLLENSIIHKNTFNNKIETEKYKFYRYHNQTRDLDKFTKHAGQFNIVRKPARLK